MDTSTTTQYGIGFSPLVNQLPQGKPPTAPEPEVRNLELAASRRVVAFFVFLALSLFAVHQLIQYGMRRIETGGFGVTNRIVSGRVNADIVISGSSRALTHYDPRVIEEITGRTAFNIGRNGSQTDMQLAVLKTYLRHNKPPKLLIQNLDSFSFVETREIYDPAQYLPYLNEAPIYEAVAKISPSAWKWRRLPLYGYAVEDMRFSWMHGLRCLTGDQPAETHFHGFLPRYTDWTGEFEKFQRANPNGVRFEIEAQGVRDLEQIIENAHAAGADVLLVYSPVYHLMRDMERSRNETFQAFAELSRRHSVPVWDFSYSPISSSQANFYNSQHLNSAGAAAFSREVAKRLLTELPSL